MTELSEVKVSITERTQASPQVTQKSVNFSVTNEASLGLRKGVCPAVFLALDGGAVHAVCVLECAVVKCSTQ